MIGIRLNIVVNTKIGAFDLTERRDPGGSLPGSAAMRPCAWEGVSEVKHA
jgi:hypothetical protein